MGENTKTSEDLSLAQLNIKKNKELSKIFKQEIVLALIKSTKINSPLICDTSNFERALAAISVQNHIKLDENYVLGLDEFKDVQLTYTERKAIREHILENLPKKYQPILNRLKEIRENHPNIFQIENLQKEILELETKRRDLYVELIDSKNNTFELLKVCAQLKLGPYLKNGIDLLHSESRLNYAKTTAFQRFLLHNFFSRTEYTPKAVKEVLKYIEGQNDNQLAN